MPTISDYLTDLSNIRDLLVARLYEGGAITQTEYENYKNRTNVLSLSDYISRVENYKKFARTYAIKATTPTVLLGDVNNNGIVDIIDYQKITNLIRGVRYTNVYKYTADYNQDGSITSEDSDLLSQAITHNNFETKPIYEIPDYAFENCSNLKEITILEGVKSIGKEAFLKCKGLTSISIPSSVTRIGQQAFALCQKLTSIEFSEGLQGIHILAFMYCSSLSSITIPSTVVSILSQAFDSCSNLTTVTFKGTPQHIYNNIFRGCTNLTDIYVPWSEGEVANAPWGATNATIHYNTET